MASQLLTGFAIGTALAGVATWLGWFLVLAHARVVERWGRRLGAYLVLKGRNLRKKSIALAKERRVLRLEREKSRNPRTDRANHNQNSRNRRNRSPEGVHNVVPFRRKG